MYKPLIYFYSLLLLVTIGLVTPSPGIAQTGKAKIINDTTEFTGRNGATEVLFNLHSRDTLGFLMNLGGGRVGFRTPTIIGGAGIGKVYATMSLALQNHDSVNSIIQVLEDGVGGTFIVKDTGNGIVPDTAKVFLRGDGKALGRDESQAIFVNALWFGLRGDGVTDNYDAFQRLASWASKRNGVTVFFPKGVYRIDTMKTGTPKMKTNIVERDSVIIDSTGETFDTTIITIIDTVTTVSQTYIPNNITDIIWRDPQNLHIIGDGAVIDIKGDFDRKWTHSTASGFTHMSAYNTVCPFEIWWGRNVTIEGITINGNDDKTTETTKVNEGQAYGMVFRGTDGITVKNCYIHHIQTDALYIEGSAGGADGPNGGKHYHASRNANVENVIVEYCGRQALTIGGLNVGKFTNCHFDATGDTTGLGTQPFAFRGHAPQKGLDIEPIFELSHSNLIRTDRWTSNITFENCTFLDNRGGSIALSHPYTVKDITFKSCTLDNSKYNRLYNVISGIVGLTFDDCDINTGTGGMYITRDHGLNQRVTIRNNVITSGGSGFLSGKSAQYGAIVEGNIIIGNHDTTYKGYFPVISSNAIFRNNTIIIDSALYLGSAQKMAAQIFSQTAEGNTFISQMDTLAGRPLYAVYYTYPRIVRGENYNLQQAIRPAGGWDGSYFTAAETGIGAVQVAYGGANKPIKTYWLPSLPTKGQFNEGDVLWMTKPLTTGYSLYRCTIGGDAALGTTQFVPVGAISVNGPMVYHNAHVVTASDDYIGRAIDSGATSKIATALLPNGGVYLTKAANDTGIIAFKSPFTFGAVLADIIIEGTILVRGKAQTDFTVNAKTNGNFTLTSPALKISGDSSLLSTKVRWLKDAGNAYYLAFNDTNTVNIDKTVISFSKITLTSATTANLTNATTAWTPLLIKSLSGFTATNMTNTNSVNYTYITNKPTIPAQVNPIAGTNMSITGTYPNLTFNSTGGLGSSNYHLPYDGISTHYMGGDTVFHALPTIPAQLNATAGTGMSITGTYPNLTFATTGSLFSSATDQTYTGTFTTDGTAATSPANLKYSWATTPDGKMTTLVIRFKWGSPSSTMTFLDFPLPGDCPVPAIPSDVTQNNGIIQSGLLLLQPSNNLSSTIDNTKTYLKRSTSSTSGFMIELINASFSYQGFFITLTYVNQ